MTYKQALAKIGENIIADARTTLKNQVTTYKSGRTAIGHIATGKLYNSMKSKITDEQITFELTPYARYVDVGRKKGTYAPIKSIKDWCKVKGIDENFAYAINRKIFNEGIEASLFFTNAFEKNTKNMDDQIDAYVNGLLDELLE